MTMPIEVRQKSIAAYKNNILYAVSKEIAHQFRTAILDTKAIAAIQIATQLGFHELASELKYEFDEIMYDEDAEQMKYDDQRYEAEQKEGDLENV